MKTKTEKELKRGEMKNAILTLIKNSAKDMDNFVFEKLQDFMVFKDGIANWTQNVKFRMIENNEAYENGYRKAKQEFNKKVGELKEEMVVVFDDIKDQEQMEIIIDKIFNSEKEEKSK